MRKLFFAICFNLLLCLPVLAKVTPVSGYDNIPAMPQDTENKAPEVHDVEFDDFKHFIQERFTTAPKADSASINKNIGYLPSLTRQQMEKENDKGIFQKIYEQALERIITTPAQSREDVADNQADTPEVSVQEQNWETPDVPVITAYLPPHNTPFTIPALEHIPYLMNSIEVLPSGLVKFEETIVVVSNGNKLKRGLTKILPLYVYDSKGNSQKLDYSILSVRVNDMPIEYHLTSNGRNALLLPENDYRLSPGIYTYKFEYVVDNLLWDYGDFYQLYWDIGGNGWNLVVDRLGASLALPIEEGIISQEVLLGSARRLSSNAVNMRPNGRFATAYIATRPLFIGEGMHLIANINKRAVLPPTFWQNIVRSFYDYGDIYLSLLGFAVIVGSFVISWRYITKDKGQLKLILPKTAMVMRYLLFNRFDVKSVCGFLLELYKKNIIDIQQSDNTILLIKRTDNVKTLQNYEIKALRCLFPSHETVFTINDKNHLPLKRFASYLERGLQKQMLKFRIKLNLGYLLFSLGMLLTTEAFMAFFKLNSLYSFTVMFCASLACLAAIALWQFGHRRWLKVLARLFSLDIILTSFIIFAAVVHPLAGVLLISSIIAIVVALGVYSKRLGLIKHYIQEIADYRDYLLKHHDNIVLSRDFIKYQAAIWALDLENDFVLKGQPEYYKLGIMNNVLSLLK